jgi:hypothetical protein
MVAPFAPPCRIHLAFNILPSFRVFCSQFSTQQRSAPEILHMAFFLAVFGVTPKTSPSHSDCDSLPEQELLPDSAAAAFAAAFVFFER